jgi:hypothetical protein
MSAFTAKGFKFTIKGVNLRQRNAKLPTVISVGSLIFMTIIVLLSDPTKGIGWSILFFGLLFIFINTFAANTVRLQSGTVSHKARKRIALGASFVVVCLMLRSASSLSLLDLFVLVLIFSGFIFYFSHRS